MQAASRLMSWSQQSSIHSPVLPQSGAKGTTKAIKSILKHTDDEYTLELLFDSLLLSALSVKIKTKSNTIFNTRELHDASAAIHIPCKGNFVLVSGPAGHPLDLCMVVCVKRNTVDVQLIRMPLPLETRNFSVDFGSINLLPVAKTI
jgi:hypothetical protein